MCWDVSSKRKLFEPDYFRASRGRHPVFDDHRYRRCSRFTASSGGEWHRGAARQYRRGRQWGHVSFGCGRPNGAIFAQAAPGPGFTGTLSFACAAWQQPGPWQPLVVLSLLAIRLVSRVPVSCRHDRILVPALNTVGAVLLAVLLAFSGIGCGGGSSSQTNPPPQQQLQQQPQAATPNLLPAGGTFSAPQSVTSRTRRQAQRFTTRPTAQHRPRFIVGVLEPNFSDPGDCGAGDSHRRESHGKHSGQRELQVQNALGHLLTVIPTVKKRRDQASRGK